MGLGGGGRGGEGLRKIGRPAPLPIGAGSLASVGFIVTGHSGRYSVLVAGFLYI